MNETAADISEIIPLSEPEICGNEWKYVKDCLDRGWVSSAGDYVVKFEKRVAEITGRRFAAATSSGTTALHIALLVAGVEPGDEVLVSGLSFIAPANAISYCGAEPVFMDAEPDYWQMDPDKVRDFLRDECKREGGSLYNKSTGRRVRAIVPVDILGHPADLDSIMDIAGEYGLSVISDAAESAGAKYKGKPAGSMGDIACLSFNGNKVVTAGAGGMIVTDDEDWARRAKYLTTQGKEEGIEYVHNEVGYNYRMNNLNAAVGCAQLENLDKFVQKKRRIAEVYSEAFEYIEGITCPRESEDAYSSYWLYTILVNKDKFGRGRDDLIRELDARGIKCRPLWQPLYYNRPYAECRRYRIEVIDDLYQRAVSLPSSVGLTEVQQDRVIEAVTELENQPGK